MVPFGKLLNKCLYIFTLKQTFDNLLIFEVSHFNARWSDKCVNICDCRHDLCIYFFNIFDFKEP